MEFAAATSTATTTILQECFPNSNLVDPGMDDDDASSMLAPPTKASSTVLEWNRHAEFLSNAMSDFFRSGYQVDTSVTFGGERLIGVHRLLMAAFLPTFKRAVDASDGPLAELNFDYVANSIDDVTALLEFLYTGRTTVSNHRLDQLSRLAKDLCFEGLSDAIAVHYRTNTASRTSNVDSEPDQESIIGLVTVKEELCDTNQDRMDDASNDLDHLDPHQIIVKMEPIDYQEDQSCSNEDSSIVSDSRTINPTDVCSVVVEARHITKKPMTHASVNKTAGLNNSASNLGCELCDMKFSSIWDLRIHFRCTHPNDKLHECRKCDFNSVSDMLLFNHVASVHKSSVTPTVTIAPATAGATSTTKMSTSEATTTISPASGLFPCDQCGEKFTLPSSLLRHVADVHDILNPYHCMKCTRSFASRYWLATHVKLKHPDKSTIKDYSKPTQKTIVGNKHLSSNVTPTVVDQAASGNFLHEGKLRCELCNMKFDSKMDLRIHFRCSHPTRKLFVCKKCEFVTVAERRMERHRRGLAHNGFSSSERFSCTECGKEYSMACSLQRHMTRVHSGQTKRFQCRDCPQSFATRYNLTRHITIKHPLSQQNETNDVEPCTGRDVDPEPIDSNLNELNADVVADSEESSLDAALTEC